MRALRLRRLTGVRGVLTLVSGTLTAVAIVVGGIGRPGTTPTAVILAIGGIALMVGALGQYERTSTVRGYEEVLLALLRSDREYTLALRPFGRDGEVILPKAAGKRVGGVSGGFTPNVTMEQVVATAARTALDLDAYGIVDQGVWFAPPGLTLMRASDDDWRMVVQRLIRRAHSIVLILPPGQDIRGGFGWEIEQIVRYRRQPRVIMVLPPCDQDAQAHQHALRQVGVLLTMLGCARGGTEFPADTMIVKCAEHMGVSWWSLEPAGARRTSLVRRKAVVADSSYLDALVEALRATEVELSDRSFDARYA